MSLKSIVLLYNGFDHELDALQVALKLAKQHAAQVRIIHPQAIHHPYVGFYGAGAALGADFYEAMEKRSEEQLANARDVAGRACREHALELDAPSAASNEASVALYPVRFHAARSLLRMVSLCDIIIVGQAEGRADLSEDTPLGAAVFSSHRPVLLVRPHASSTSAEWTSDTVLVAWRDTPESTRAVINALPLLKAARQVFVVTAYSEKSPLPDDEQERVVQYLEAHGVKLQARTIDQASGDAANAIMVEASKVGADFVVMGAYGHSTFREFLLGGFSASMLEECPLPILLSH